jgi:hypothetical protein
MSPPPNLPMSPRPIPSYYGIFDNINKGYFLGFEDSPAEFVKLLNLCVEAVGTVDSVQGVLASIVNNQLQLLIETVLRFDPLILNKLFVPELGDLKFVTIHVFNNIRQRLKRTDTDVFSLAVFIDIPDTEFNKMVHDKFYPSAISSRFKKEIYFFQ